MKKIFILLPALVLLISCGSVPVRPAQYFIDETKADVCPDRRVNIFDVEYEQNGKAVILEGEGYTVANRIRLLPAQELEGKIYGVVRRPVANIRVEASARSEMATQAVLGVPIRVYKKHEKSSDMYIQTPDGYLGWIERGAYTAMTPAEFKAWREAEKIIYLADAGYVYEEASCKSAKVSDITAKSFLKELGREGNYIHVAYPDGREGYVKAQECANFNEWKKNIIFLTK